MTITTSAPTRAAGASAVLSGLLFIVIQPIHPPENVATVTGTAWVVVALMTIAMAVLGPLGLSGIYFRQVRESGPLGLLGYVMLGGFYLVPIAFGLVFSMVDSLTGVAGWIDLTTAQAPLFDHSIAGVEWLQLLATTTGWILLPVASGLWRLLHQEIK